MNVEKWHQVGIRLTDRQKKALEKRMKKAGVSNTASFCRELIMEGIDFCPRCNREGK